MTITELLFRNNRAFLRLLTYRVQMSLAYQSMAVVVGWHIYELTRDPWSLGLVGLAEVIPYFSTALFAIKFGLALGGAVVGWVLGMVDYAPGQATQAPGVLSTINALVCTTCGYGHLGKPEDPEPKDRVCDYCGNAFHPGSRINEL